MKAGRIVGGGGPARVGPPHRSAVPPTLPW